MSIEILPEILIRISGDCVQSAFATEANFQLRHRPNRTHKMRFRPNSNIGFVGVVWIGSKISLRSLALFRLVEPIRTHLVVPDQSEPSSLFSPFRPRRFFDSEVGRRRDSVGIANADAHSLE